MPLRLSYYQPVLHLDHTSTHGPNTDCKLEPTSSIRSCITRFLQLLCISSSMHCDQMTTSCRYSRHLSEMVQYSNSQSSNSTTNQEDGNTTLSHASIGAVNHASAQAVKHTSTNDIDHASNGVSNEVGY
ncbi:hypothetical protein EB796_004097 [Bugula neritina]|uniref:Uncharacterized protein n=1 Tax=Bugula neritina TaxID=10212 RepID=A0A7J7KI51_BUGNE|nr:hypothetical protein EB796_004097 [Bugula neritina]